MELAAEHARSGEGRDAFAAEVRHYLMQRPRQLPSRYFYDELGTALFEAICRLPWYSITRAEARLLLAHGAEIFRRVAPLATIVELGSGSGEKLMTLLGAAGPAAGPQAIHLVDLSAAALELASRLLAPLDHFRLTTHEAPFETGLHDAVGTFSSGGHVLVLFLGSNIGNFDPPACNALLRRIRSELRAGDALLLGADLVKPEAALHLAYDDPLGVTGAFNRNLLVRVNRELGGNFVIDQYAHLAPWNQAASRVEMHLVARSDQQIRVAGAGIEFAMEAGETIWTESSYKFQADEIVRRLETSGFRASGQWIDERDRFALTLSEAL
ncbi:conserved hypothetical protein [Burkholderiales bacterium]|nr:conserved hypothetical protein [Burkholderiales bacterium]